MIKRSPELFFTLRHIELFVLLISSFGLRATDELIRLLVGTRTLYNTHFVFVSQRDWTQ